MSAPEMAPERRVVLVLGGTTEAVSLADRLMTEWGDRFDIVTSLAGRTQTPGATPGEVRVGGFGGVAPMARSARRPISKRARPMARLSVRTPTRVWRVSREAEIPDRARRAC